MLPVVVFRECAMLTHNTVSLNKMAIRLRLEADINSASISKSVFRLCFFTSLHHLRKHRILERICASRISFRNVACTSRVQHSLRRLADI